MFDDLLDLRSAIRRGDLETVRSLLQQGVRPIDEPLKAYRRLPLVATAAFNNDPEMASLLLANGADPDAEEYFGVTALAVARSPEMYDLLAAHGATQHPVKPLTWLKERVTHEQVDAACDKILDPERWAHARRLIRPGDERWSFSSPADTWAGKCGGAGYALVRDGIPIRSMVTLRN